MDRLETLANNSDNVKSGQNNRRVARIREYDAEIGRLRSIEAEALSARDVINNGGIQGDFIPGQLRNRLLQILETVRPELIRLESERTAIAKQVQR